MTFCINTIDFTDGSEAVRNITTHVAKTGLLQVQVNRAQSLGATVRCSAIRGKLTSVYRGTRGGWYWLSLRRVFSVRMRPARTSIVSSGHMSNALPLAVRKSSRQADPTLHRANCHTHHHDGRPRQEKNRQHKAM